MLWFEIQNGVEVVPVKSDNFCNFPKMSKPGTNLPRRLKGLNPVFHKKTKAEDDAVVSETVLKLAKKSGKLNLSSRNLSSGEHFTRFSLDPCKNMYFSSGRSAVTR